MQLDRIYTGDSANILRNKERFRSGSVDLIVTSPPYGHKRKHAYGGIRPEHYVSWFLPVAEQLKRILKPTGSFILNIKEGATDCERETYVLELVLALRDQGWLWIEEFCWYKKNSFPGKWRHRFRDSWERCYHFARQKDFRMYQDAVRVPIGDWTDERFRSMSQKDYIRNVSGTNSNLGRNVANWLDRKKVYPHNVVVFEKEHYERPPNVLRFSTSCKNHNHSAVFPLELPTWFIKLFTRSGNVVLDPFMGVGTTAIAATLLNRSYLGVEIVPEHAQSARRRIREAKRLKKDSGIIA